MIRIADPTFGVEERNAVETVLEEGMVADGPRVRRFEDEFADYCGVAHAVATANGTAALQVALEAVGIGSGDTVVTTPFSFVASSNAIRMAGAEPVFADIDPETYNLDPDAARAAIRDTDADALLVVHLYGLPVDVDAFVDIAEEEDVRLIEDAAQAHGGEYRTSAVGSFGDAAAFSFYPTKNMTTGEGGMVLTPDADVADRARSLINHGRAGTDPYAHDRVGYNLRMTSLAAAIGSVQLEKLPDWVEQRRNNATSLSERLAFVPEITIPTEPDDRRHSYHQYTIRHDDRAVLQSRLANEGVEANVYYPTVIPHLDAYDGYEATVPAARRAAETVLSLPVHPGLTADDIDRIARAVRQSV